MDEKWYYYASATCEYFCKFGDDVQVPLRFVGPFESRSEAIQEYLAWKVEQMEPDAYEYAE